MSQNDFVLIFWKSLRYLENESLEIQVFLKKKKYVKQITKY